MSFVTSRASGRSMLLAILATVLLLGACSTSPTGLSQLDLVSEEQLDQMGAEAYDEIRAQKAVARGTGINRYVRCVVTAITAQVDGPHDWQVTVFDDPAANAFALPGGRIGVNTGMLEVAENQDQLATVIGHEVAHVIAEHPKARISAAYATQAGITAADILTEGSSEGLTGLLGLGAEYGILKPYGRSQENEADLLGLDLMAKAGFEPSQSIALWQNMARREASATPAFLSTHPSHGQRIDALRERLPRARSLLANASRRPACG